MDGAEQAAVVIPIDPFQRFPLNLTHRFPWTDLVDDFGFEEADDALGQGIVHCPPLGVQARLPGNGQCMFTCMRGIGVTDGSD